MEAHGQISSVTVADLTVCNDLGMSQGVAVEFDHYSAESLGELVSNPRMLCRTFQQNFPFPLYFHLPSPWLSLRAPPWQPFRPNLGGRLGGHLVFSFWRSHSHLPTSFLPLLTIFLAANLTPSHTDFLHPHGSCSPCFNLTDLSLPQLRNPYGRYRVQLFKPDQKPAVDPEEAAKVFLEAYSRTRRSIFAGRLPRDVTEEELHKFFDRFGKIAEIRILQRDSPDGRWPFAFVEFQSDLSCKEALRGKPKRKFRDGDDHFIVVDQKNDGKQGGGKASAAVSRVSSSSQLGRNPPSLSAKASFGSNATHGSVKRLMPTPTKNSVAQKKSYFKPLETTFEGSDEEVENLIAASKTVKGKGKSMVGRDSKPKIVASVDSQGRSVIKLYGIDYELVPMKKTEDRSPPTYTPAQSIPAATSSFATTTQGESTSRYNLAYQQRPSEFVTRANHYMDAQVGIGRSNFEGSILNRPLCEAPPIRSHAPIGYERQFMPATSVAGNVSPKSVLEPLLRGSVADVTTPFQTPIASPAPIGNGAPQRSGYFGDGHHYGATPQVGSAQQFGGSQHFGGHQHRSHLLPLLPCVVTALSGSPRRSSMVLGPVTTGSPTTLPGRASRRLPGCSSRLLLTFTLRLALCRLGLGIQYFWLLWKLGISGI
ncbi:hypothetical protein QBC34DRAFT_17581 [Podospora aff. communis PSN243]|uniref:RRM domain-containing protein n=1 Tax=Podospora aff. communis PSN243 TaxID=3040156 RepID=A0AAV9GX77_9PEZI|nr:hypothetical protein QBC34DRAFT_17581 [Podospora aff. communis PSN243]